MKINISFEQLTEDRIGFGRYQYTVLGLLGCIFMADGIEMASLNSILPILKTEWQIDADLQGLLGTMLFIGFFFGSLLSAFFTDRLGRKETLQYVSVIQFVLGVYSTTATNVYIFLFVRGTFGLLIGFIMPLIPTLCAEMIPGGIRGRATVVINCLFSVGQLISSVIAYFCLNSLSVGNWRLLLLISSFPPVLVFFGSYFWFKESPRFVMLKGDIEQGIQILNYIGKINKGNMSHEFSSKDIKAFQNWRENSLSDHKPHAIDQFKLLFSPKYRVITISMWTIWFCITFLFYGILFILPLFLNQRDILLDLHDKTHGGIMILVITSVGEAISGIFAYVLIDTETFGRKRTLTLFIGIAAISCFVTYFSHISSFYVLVVFLALARTFAKANFSVIYPFIAEIYPTSLRLIGVGLASAVGRFASCIMPMIAIRLFYYDMFSPFILYFVIGVVGFVATLTVPFDTRGKHLDTELEEQMLV
jgi:putative MFS transporter